MGRDKASLVIGDSTLINVLASRFYNVLGPVIVVARRNQNLESEFATIINDVFKEKGPLGGLHAGLLASPDQCNFVTACDMPFANPMTAHYLFSQLNGHDAVVPLVNQRPEPLNAVYSRSCLTQIEANLQSDSLRLRELLDEIDTLYINEDDLRSIDADLRSFVNINTPEEYARLSQT